MIGVNSQPFLLANALNTIEQNHELLAQNIANVNTPNYKTKQLVFDDFVRSVKDGTAQQGLLGKLPVELVSGLQVRKDGNNVDLDGQVGEMKKNALLFQTYSHILASQMSMARRAMQR